MTDQIQKARRAAFEASVKLPEGVVWCSDQAKYVGMNYWLADYGFAAFNAALDSLCIELPLMDCIVDEDGFIHDVMRAEDVRAAIEQTNMGIKIK
ncbi:MAG: hypothetical protein K5804_17790 [Microbacterium sp.]|uniref:hypothetical protein n=1 Tax=Microbacterium sp. TaxID=51671 RepID=UPI0026152B5A|nr:hypothetical protein [Microbacterium sp.]MCV0420097.1 hypothetical protein [Microbacterium sp.]